MRPHYQYLCYVIRHKWFVFLAACKLGIPILGLVHDWSKFRPSEWSAYVHFFYGDRTKPYRRNQTGQAAFDLAWLYHQKRNKHHWQWWVMPEDDGDTKILPMGDRFRREMVADWRGAGKALGKPDTKAWYVANRDNMQLHPITRKWIDDIFGMTL
jgi:hypothetical protein